MTVLCAAGRAEAEDGVMVMLGSAEAEKTSATRHVLRRTFHHDVRWETDKDELWRVISCDDDNIPAP